MSILKIIIKIFSKLMHFVDLEHIKINYYKYKISNIMLKVFVKLYIKLEKYNFNKILTFLV